MGIPPENGAAIDRETIVAANLQVALQLINFARSGYGPRGGHKLLVDGEEGVLRDSPAAALREIQIGDALVRPYKNLASSVQAHVGDGGTTALLLAARLVERALEGVGDGIPAQASIQGYDLARRQSLAVLGSMARPGEPHSLLAGFGEADWAEVVVAGLTGLGTDLQGELDLDRIDIRVEPGEVRWLEGLIVEPTAAPDETRIVDAGVLILAGDWDAKSAGADMRAKSMAGLDALRQDERARARKRLADVVDAGARLLVATKSIPDDVVHDLTRAGIVVCTNVTADAVERMATATGAKPIQTPSMASADALGRADLHRRPVRLGGWSVRGPGPSATLVINAPPGMSEAAKDHAERLLRAAGPVIADPRGVPGGGGWQRHIAAALRKAAPQAPGKAALAVARAGSCFDSLADDLLRTAGLDPMAKPVPLQAPDEPFVAMEHAVSAAFEVARQIIRLDGRYDKRPSSAEGLRGGTGPAGSPLGMPGDVPPLM